MVFMSSSRGPFWGVREFVLLMEHRKFSERPPANAKGTQKKMARVDYEPAEGSIDASWGEVLQVYIEHLAEKGKLRKTPASFSACLRPTGVQDVVSLRDEDTIDISFWEEE
jgi:hypothetical protein